MIKEILKNNKWNPMVRVTNSEFAVSNAYNALLDAIMEVEEDKIEGYVSTVASLLNNLKDETKDITL